MKGRSSAAGTIAALTLTCVFGATMLLSLATGASVYRNVAERVESASGRRVGLTYITAKIHAYDQQGRVSAGDFGGQDAVFLLQEIDGNIYETILYVYEGQLMELFCEQGWELEPRDGQSITAAESLTVWEGSPGLLRLSYTGADGRTEMADVFLRSAGGQSVTGMREDLLVFDDVREL